MTNYTIEKQVVKQQGLNRDPISGTPGAHPLGTTAGATSGAVAGAAAGLAVAGPIGGLAGIAVGAVAGGLAGKGVAEAVNPTAEEKFWQASYVKEPYYMKGKPYEYYAPGFRAGWEGRVRHDGRSFEDAEPDLMAEYNQTRSRIDPDWNDIKPAARAAWNRVEQRRNIM